MPDPSAEGEARDPGRADHAAGRDQPVCLGRGVEVEPRGPALGGGEARVGNVLGQPDEDVDPELPGDLLVEEAAEAATPRIDPADQLALVEAERQRMVRLLRAGLPRGRLARQHDGQPIEIGDDVAIDELVEREQTSLVGQQLPDGDAVLAVLATRGNERGHWIRQPDAAFFHKHHHGRRRRDHFGE